MKLGLQVPNYTWPGGSATIGADLAAIARAADDAGFEYLALPDHFFQMPTGDRGAGIGLNAGLVGGHPYAGDVGRSDVEPTAPRDIAYLIVRLSESFVYKEVIVGEAADPDQAAVLFRMVSPQ
jgi:hypothetical protein